jgi:flagellar biosynthesis protein FlhG
VFVDADLDHGGQTQLAHTSEGGSVLDVLAGRRSVHEVLQRGPSGIQVLSGAWGVGAATEVPRAAHDRFVAELAHLAPHAEVVVVDAGRGRGTLARRLWQAAGAVVVVTTPDDAAVMQCYAAIKVLAPDKAAAVHTLVNLAGDASGRDVHARVAEACRRFLGIQTIAAATTVACDAMPAGDGVLVLGARSDPARALDRAADMLWARLQQETLAAPNRRRVASAATAC